MYEINALPAQLSLGNQGEGGVTLVQIDVSAWLTEWPAGVFAVTFIPPMMTEPAPVPVAVEAGMLSFTVSKGMTARYGTGTLVIKLIEGEDLEKRSVVVQTKVLESHPPATGTMPTVVQDWVDAATARLALVKDGASITEADFIGNDIVFTKDNALTVTLADAKSALKGDQGIQGPQGLQGVQGPKGDPGNVMYATFDIIDGELIVTTPDGYTGPTFSINNETGELEVSI